MSDLKRYGLLRFSKKTGKIDRQLEATGKALLNLWALQNTTKNKNSVVYELDTELIVDMFYGNETGFPNVMRNCGCRQEYLHITDTRKQNECAV